MAAMACGCPVATSQSRIMPEIAGGAAILLDPGDPGAIARAIIEAMGPGRIHLRELGLKRVGEFTRATPTASTLDVYREVAERRGHRQK
jgi:glycosyltransferase involved in cell wall biosynthesis